MRKSGCARIDRRRVEHEEKVNIARVWVVKRSFFVSGYRAEEYDCLDLGMTPYQRPRDIVNRRRRNWIELGNRRE